MLKRLFLAALAALFVVVGCDKPENNTNDGTATASDLLGTWEMEGVISYTFATDGKYTQVMGRDTVAGTWSLSGSKLSVASERGEEWDADIQLVGGKAWLVVIMEGGEGERQYRNFEIFKKVGATVKSAPLGDGRWDSPRNGIKPQEFTDSTDYTTCMIIKGDAVDMYIPAWGLHFEGTYTLADGRMHIETDDDHIWQAWYYEKEDELNWYFGWTAWDSPLENDKDWDVTCSGIFAERLTPQKVYSWYSVTDILALGEDPANAPADADLSSFKYRVYEEGLGIREEALYLCDFELCVTDDGKEAYGGPVPLSPWFYKR